MCSIDAMSMPFGSRVRQVAIAACRSSLTSVIASDSLAAGTNARHKPPGSGAVLKTTSAIAPSVPSEPMRSEEHTSELQSQSNLVCRLLLEKKKKKYKKKSTK